MIVKPNQKIQVLASNNDGPQEVIVSGVIGDWGLQGKDLRNALDGIPKGKKINLRVNSEGGSVQDGLEMYHAIKSRASDTTAYIHGYALSAASVFPLAAGRVVSPEGSIWMIHKAAASSYGNDDDKLKDAEMLKAHDDEMATIYAAKTGKSKKAILGDMKAETWMTSAEAKEYGLADENPAADEDDEPILSMLDTTKFSHVPEPLLLAITMRVAKSAAGAGGNRMETQMNKKKLAAKLKELGVEASEDWSEDQLLEALAKIKPVTAQLSSSPSSSAVQVGAITQAQLDALTARLDAEKMTRIRAEVLRRAENKIPNDK